MRGTAPPPLVPEMVTETEPPAGTAATPDGGERRTLPDRTFGAPLVPDVS